MKKRLLGQRVKTAVVSSGSSTTFMWPLVRQLSFLSLCLHSLYAVTYVICNLHAKKIDKSSLIQSTIPGHTS